MKKFFAAIILLAALAAPALAKAPDAIGYRRTLFAPAGQKMVTLEAPVGMCFIDPSYPAEGAVAADMQSVLDETSGGRLLGIFAPCLSIAALDLGGKGTPAMGVFGVVTQLNPSVGETTPLAQGAYLDMQQENFRAYLNASLGDGDDEDDGIDDDDAGTSPGALTPAYAALLLPWPGDYRFDKRPERTDNDVSVGYTASVNRGDKAVASGVAATAVVKHVPIAVYLNYVQETPYDQKKLRALADKFMAQQVALNK